MKIVRHSSVSRPMMAGLLIAGLTATGSFVQAADIKTTNPELERSSVVVITQPTFKFVSTTEFSWAVNNHADISGAFKK